MNFTKLEDINITDASQILNYPNTGDPLFWGKILVSIWIVLGLSLFFEERSRTGKANFMSSFAVSSFAIMVLTFVGTTFGVITEQVLTGTFIIGGLVIAIWYLGNQK